MMNSSNRLVSAKRATQFVFLVCGLGLSSWAPMVPFAKDRLAINEADLGLLLLLLGLGAMFMMPITGMLMSRFGSRRLILCGVLLAAIMLPLLLIIPSFVGMAIALFFFGAAVGTIDVAMNSHGVQVQNLYGRPIMSSLHGLFSVGGLIGSLGLGFLIKLGLNPMHAALTISILLILLLSSQYKNLFDFKYERETIAQFSEIQTDVKSKGRFQWLNGSILLLGFMCFSVFLSEGAMLDWSAILLRDIKLLPAEFAGLGYAAFSIAMAIMRLSGDKLVERLNNKLIVVGGSLIAVTGLTVVILSAWIPLVLFGFILLGLGAANIVPIFFSEGGRIKGISPTVSISAITTMGYAGQLAGPAILGYIAHLFSLEVAFGTIAAMLLIVAIIYGFRQRK